jgi:uncharacterized protein
MKKQLKQSYYTIFSDYLNQKRESILFCTRTGDSLVLSKTIRKQIEEEDFDNIPKDILSKLLLSQAVVPEDAHELQRIIIENKEEIDDNTVLYEVIQPSAMCQLGCYYCGQQHTKTSFAKEHYATLLERIRLKAQQKNYTRLAIGWFGGEPLMALQQIRELTPLFQEIADEFGMTYEGKIVTNGLSLKENIFIELVTKLAITEIEVTLDGTAEYHDSHRYTKEGGKSFDYIFNNLLSILNRPDFLELGCGVSLRCNVDKKNWEGVTPLIKLLAEHKLYEKLSYFYPIGVYSWGGNDAHNDSLTKEEFSNKEIDWMIEMFEAGFTPSILPNRVKQVCMAVSPVSEMYDPYGNIFNCTEVSLTNVYEDTPYSLGNLKDNPPAHNKVFRPLSDWNDTLLTDKFPCHTCKMLPVCGGGCPKSWHEDMRACPTAKFNIKDRLALAYIMSKTDLKTLTEA